MGSYRIQSVERSDGCAEIQNIGHGGLMFIASEPLQVGGLIDLTIIEPEYEIRLGARIVWREKLKGPLPTEFKYGVRYRDISALEQSYLSLIIGSEGGAG
jgi:hypothetical protein